MQMTPIKSIASTTVGGNLAKLAKADLHPFLLHGRFAPVRVLQTVLTRSR